MIYVLTYSLNLGIVCLDWDAGSVRREAVGGITESHPSRFAIIRTKSHKQMTKGFAVVSVALMAFTSLVMVGIWAGLEVVKTFVFWYMGGE